MPLFGNAPGSEEPAARALDRIARPAAVMQAEVSGPFVEDIVLLHLAALPSAAEFCRFTQRHRLLQGAEMERQLRTQAAAAEVYLLALGASRRVLLRERDLGFAVEAAAGKRALEVARDLADADGTSCCARSAGGRAVAPRRGSAHRRAQYRQWVSTDRGPFAERCDVSLDGEPTGSGNACL